MREDAVQIVQVEEVDEPNGRMPPPKWVAFVVVMATVGWVASDPPTGPCSISVFEGCDPGTWIRARRLGG